ncbi:MAG: type III-B CRISPR-associated protein Cas10/Cmr2 [Verrucomicrobiae bacterium]|nr:type III-B CRISPR-associated protein Cas10/Cmr2 [Verrucomicrobiae bacterium]
MNHNAQPPIPGPDFWKRKLAAYLHDPPEKAYNFGPNHIERAEIHAASFGVAELWRNMAGNSDWTAAAADRFVFPHGNNLRENIGEDASPCFIHPMSGRAEKPALVQANFPSEEQAQQWLAEIRQDWTSDDAAVNFLRTWRKWSACAAEHHGGQNAGAKFLPYLPADTRVCDGTIWHHCAIVSALEATRIDENNLKSGLAPAFFLFQVSPVQEFIAQARSTRDLWSGSYLLSWLTMHAIKAVADRFGPDAIIFPSLKGQPLYDYLERRLGVMPETSNVLVPGIPNRFLAVVRADFDGNLAAQAFNDEWKRIAENCLHWLGDRQVHLPEGLFRAQVEHYWHIAWQLWPWQGVKEALKNLGKLPLGKSNPIHLAKIIAENIPAQHRDNRCYRDDQLDPGWAWSAHYQLCQHALDARRSLREFMGLPTNPQARPGHRDALSGKEEAVLSSDAIENLQNAEVSALFRHADPLGAANVIKRVWHKAYLARLQEINGGRYPCSLSRACKSFDSVPSVAAGQWLYNLKQRLEDNAELRADLVALSSNLHQVADNLKGVSVGSPIERDDSWQVLKWLEATEVEIFTDRFWQNHRGAIQGNEHIQAAAQQVHTLKQKHKLEEPPAYYAVLALDGDQIGKWLSGEKSPSVEKVISPRAAAYFAQQMPGTMTPEEQEAFNQAATEIAMPEGWQGAWPPQTVQEWIRAWLASPRPISPSWHLQFSEALANFGLYAARRIVEEVHHGQLIYAGGDDVLAMLPADEAVQCAKNLRAAFQGRRQDMTPRCQELFRENTPEGFLWLERPGKNDPSWPLLVPGPRMTVSVGLAIGHVKEPLQDMIAEAQKAEKRAKSAPEREVFDHHDTPPAPKWKAAEGWDRDALAVTLYKRSGETIRWGAKFGSPAFPLLEYFQTHFRDNPLDADTPPPISGRFPYRLAELLERYGLHTNTDTLRDIAAKEVAYVISRQTTEDANGAAHGAFNRATLQELCMNYLEHLAEFSWRRPREQQAALVPRPIGEFVNLFLIETFIRRQAD